MTTITIELTEEQVQQLAEEAHSLHVTTEDLVARRVIETMGHSRPNFREIARQVIEENAELYRRLA